ncbi:MAG: hypothetical protein ACKOBW_13520 [Planctomycetota bacterium]
MSDGVKRVLLPTSVVGLALLTAVFFRQPVRQPLKQTGPQKSVEPPLGWSPLQLHAPQRGGRSGAERPGSERPVVEQPGAEQPGAERSLGLLPTEEPPVERRPRAESIRTRSRIESEPPRATRLDAAALPPTLQERYQPLEPAAEQEPPAD